MAAKIIKELQGFSGNQILLMQENNELFVRKIGNIGRNTERMQALASEYPLPEIYTLSKKMIDMEYLHGLDIKSYLKTHASDKLLSFIIDILDRLSKNSTPKDYTETYIKKLQEVDFTEFQIITET